MNCLKIVLNLMTNSRYFLSSSQFIMPTIVQRVLKVFGAGKHGTKVLWMPASLRVQSNISHGERIILDVMYLAEVRDSTITFFTRFGLRPHQLSPLRNLELIIKLLNKKILLYYYIMPWKLR